MGAKACKYCPCRTEIQGAGSVLDRVISQSSNEDQCILYKLVNYKKGGELIDTYTLGGQMAVEKLIKEKFGTYMYADGRGQMINRAEYLRWKFRDHEHVVLPIEASLSRHDPLAKWFDHEACWQMRYRGALGESLLHVLIICDTKIHTRLARTLLKCFPRLALDVVEGEEYLGASSLHLAIAYSNNELVQDLVEVGSDVCQRAIGSFFLPRDQQRSPPTRHTDYEGLAYLGEYPLAWAACCANESVYNLLLDSGADPDLPDTFGNMILHMVVVCDKLDMFGYALRHPKLPASNGKVNQEGLTPLTLACKLGRAEVFREMLELSAREFWRYSNITCSAYPLNALDTLLPDGRTNWNSALFIILNGTKEEHLDMLDGGIIQRLLEEKWKTFARNQFLKRLLILFTHLLLLSIAVYMRPEDADISLLASPENAQDIIRYVCEIGTLGGVLSYLILQQGDEVKNQGLVAFLKQLSHAPDKAIFLVSNLLILACIPCRLTGDKSTEEAILVVAVPGSWFLLMFFAGAVRLTGPFVTMIYSMITGDMLTFGIIYTVVLFGFSQSFFFLYKGFPNVKGSLYSTYPSTWMALFQITLGDYSYSDLGYTTYPNLAKTVFALFMVFVPILLLNMLIAMMGNTYAHVIEQSEKEWMKQWAKIVVALERAVAQEDAHHYLQEYSIALGPSDDPRYEQRGVMVIKSKAKTRAKQRKGAVSNWKRVGKVTITELRKRGMTGEDLRRIMWGRASISTPTKVPIKPKPESVLATDGPNLAGAFGDSITAALDVMAFTHDLDLSAAAKGLNLHSTIQPAPINYAIPPGHTLGPGILPNATVNMNAGIGKPGGVYNQTKTAIETGGSMVGMLNQITDSQLPQDLTKTSMSAPTTGKPPIASGLPGYPGPPVHPIVPAQHPMIPAALMLGQPGSSAVFCDPLRALIILTEKSAFDSEDKIRALAVEAANCQHVEEVTVIPKPKKATMSTKAHAANAVSNIFGVDTVPTDSAAKPSSWKNDTKKKPPILEPSDSEGFGDVPLLGRLSRTRRARSATQRSAAEEESYMERKSSHKRRSHRFLPGHKMGNKKSLLLDLCDTSSSEQTGGADNLGFEADATNLGELEYAAARIEQLNKSSLNIYRNPGGPPQSPVAGDAKTTMKEKRPLIIEQAAASIGTPLMEAITEKAVIFKGEGSGAEVESGNNRRVDRDREKKKHDKRKPRQRPKTAKANRIAPMPRDARTKSAHHRSQSPDPDVPQNPLNNWSTANITNMDNLMPDTDPEQNSE